MPYHSVISNRFGKIPEQIVSIAQISAGASLSRCVAERRDECQISANTT